MEKAVLRETVGMDIADDQRILSGQFRCLGDSFRRSLISGQIGQFTGLIVIIFAADKFVITLHFAVGQVFK